MRLCVAHDISHLVECEKFAVILGASVCRTKGAEGVISSCKPGEFLRFQAVSDLVGEMYIENVEADGAYLIDKPLYPFRGELFSCTVEHEDSLAYAEFTAIHKTLLEKRLNCTGAKMSIPGASIF